MLLAVTGAGWSGTLEVLFHRAQPVLGTHEVYPDLLQVLPIRP